MWHVGGGVRRGPMPAAEVNTVNLYAEQAVATPELGLQIASVNSKLSS